MRAAARSRVVVATVVLVVLVAAAAGLAWWWLAVRARPESVGPRFVDALVVRRPGTTVEAWDAGVMRFALASGLYIDVRLSRVFDDCAARRLRCGDAIDRALDDVDRADRAAREPAASMLRAAVVAEALPGFRYGYVAEPLVGPLELRYALVTGVASTFVTATIADRLTMKPPALKDAALAALRAAPDFALVPVGDGPAAPVWRVEASDDAVASLLDRDRMARIAARLKTTRLTVAVPRRETLWVAGGGPDDAKALRALLARAVGSAPRAGDVGLLSYDTEAATPLAMAR